jgi:hypothetical protein
MFQKFYQNTVRIGRMLEVLDYLAVNVAYSHCYSDPGKGNQTIVTVRYWINFIIYLSIENLYINTDIKCRQCQIFWFD